MNIVQQIVSDLTQPHLFMGGLACCTYQASGSGEKKAEGSLIKLTDDVADAEVVVMTSEGGTRDARQGFKDILKPETKSTRKPFFFKTPDRRYGPCKRW